MTNDVFFDRMRAQTIQMYAHLDRLKESDISRSGNSLDISSRSGHDIPDREHCNMTIEEIGTAVRQARLAQGLRQDQLAAAAGVGLRFLVELERGKPTVRLDKVLAVLSALGCRLDVTPPPVPAGSDA